MDGNLASFFDEEQLERLLATYTPQFAALEQAAPDLARVMIPVIQSYPATVERLRMVDVPDDLPVVDVVAERSWVESPDEIEAIRRAHSDFVAASPQRRAVFADKSGHHVMRDWPDLVLEAIGSVIAAVRA